MRQGPFSVSGTRSRSSTPMTVSMMGAMLSPFPDTVNTSAVRDR